jgi:ubiquinone/menaquinone biosynthesis C-methylase UbiE
VGNFLKLDFKKQFDGVFAFAFIHLFPKKDAVRVLEKIHRILKPGGMLYVGTTESKESKEGWEVKADYQGEHKRFRKRWIEEEFDTFLKGGGFQKIAVHKITDPSGKLWMDFIVQKPN